MLRVKAADALANARSIVADLRWHGPETWQRFHAGAVDQLWYYRSLSRRARRTSPGPSQRRAPRHGARDGRAVPVVVRRRRPATGPPDHTLVAILAARGPVGRPHASAAARRAARCSSVNCGRMPSAGRVGSVTPCSARHCRCASVSAGCSPRPGGGAGETTRLGGGAQGGALLLGELRAHAVGLTRAGSVTPCSARHCRCASVSGPRVTLAVGRRRGTGVAGVGGGERVEAQHRHDRQGDEAHDGDEPLRICGFPVTTLPSDDPYPSASSPDPPEIHLNGLPSIDPTCPTGTSPRCGTASLSIVPERDALVGDRPRG